MSPVKPKTKKPKTRNSCPINKAALRAMLLNIADEERNHLPPCYRLNRVADSVFDEAVVALRLWGRNKIRSVRKGKTIV
jgi:hypothetical protein